MNQGEKNGNRKRSDEQKGDRLDSYKKAGVDLKAGERTVWLIKEAVAQTYTAGVKGGVGGFGGLFDLQEAGLGGPVLVASVDGVGTKASLGARYGRFEGLGHDIVNHCVNDILTQGAKPLFFLDYVASGRLEPENVASLVRGMGAACRAAGCALLGGETAEMPGVYREGEVDIVGAIVGAVEADKVVTGERVREGDRVLALMSGGLQTNGFSLARRVLEDRYHEALQGGTVLDALLLPHRSYQTSVWRLLERGLVRGMAHVTGGGISGNLPRALPEGLGAEIAPGSWPVPPIFKLLQDSGGISDEEMRAVFNLGAGFLLVVAPEDEAQVRALLEEEVFPIGQVVARAGVHYLS